MPFNHGTGNFITSGQPEQRGPPTQPRSFQPRVWGPGQQDHGYPTGLGGQGRGDNRGRGRGQGQQAMTTPPQLPTQPDQQGAQQGQYYPQPQSSSMIQGMFSSPPPFPPALYSQGGGQGYQPMFPMVQFPPPTPVYVGFPVMAHPIPLPGQQFPQQPQPGAIQAPPGIQRPTQQGNNQNVSSLHIIRHYPSCSLDMLTHTQSPSLLLRTLPRPGDPIGKASLRLQRSPTTELCPALLAQKANRKPKRYLSPRLAIYGLGDIGKNLRQLVVSKTTTSTSPMTNPIKRNKPSRLIITNSRRLFTG